jgi:transposase
LVEDRLWELIEPLLPAGPAPKAPGGRPRVDERAALEGILFVLHTGYRWRDRPRQLGVTDPGTPPGADCAPGKPPGCGTGCTASCSTSSPKRNRSTGPAAASTASRCGRKGGELTGRNPTDRGKAGMKYHLLVDARGLILHTLLSP